jgi:hypothetical protein
MPSRRAVLVSTLPAVAARPATTVAQTRPTPESRETSAARHQTIAKRCNDREWQIDGPPVGE